MSTSDLIVLVIAILLFVVFGGRVLACLFFARKHEESYIRMKTYCDR